MYCPNCGKENDNNANFCKYCGSPLTSGEKVEKMAPKPRQRQMNWNERRFYRDLLSKISLAAVIIGAVLMYISIFTPVLNEDAPLLGIHESVTYFNMYDKIGRDMTIYSTVGVFQHGYAAIIAILATLSLAAKYERFYEADIVCSVVSLGYAIYLIHFFNGIISNYYGVLSLGSSVYLTIVGAILMIVGSIIPFVKI